MKLIDFLKITDLGGLYLVIYVEDDEDPIWTGHSIDIPWWVADHKIAPSRWGEESISYRTSLGEEYNNKPGFVIFLMDREDD